MCVRLLLLERFVLFFWHCWRWYTFTKRHVFGQIPSLRHKILRLGAGMSGFYKMFIYETETGRGKLYIVNPKREKWRGLLLYLPVLVWR
jgi:hypothetical protein